MFSSVDRREFEVGQDPAELDLDLCAFNPWGIGAYIDGEWSDLNAMTRPQKPTYERLTPASVALSESLYKSIQERRQWGRQLASGSWATTTEEKPIGQFRIASRSTPEHPYIVEPLGNCLSQRDVLKHLVGRTCSIGSTDKPTPDAYQIIEERYSVAEVTALRIDVDQDHAWLHERHEEILIELRDQFRIVRAMGLEPLAIKTGGRGTQLIVPLPYPLQPVSASFLSRGLRMALRGRSNLQGIHVDRDSFDGLLRLPGGVHARGNTSLFIDVEAGSLVPMAEQVKLIGQCLGIAAGNYGQTHLAEAESELILKTRKDAIFDFEVCTDDSVLRILRRHPENDLSKMIEKAAKAANASLGVANSNWTRRKQLGAYSNSLIDCDAAWADAVWAKDVKPGEWWDWIHMGGDRGTLAAVIKFGPNHALDRMLEKAAYHPSASRTDQRERDATTRSLWKSFGLKDFIHSGRRTFVMSLPRPSAEINDFAASLVAIAKQLSSPSARWKVPQVLAVLSVVLQAVADSQGEGVRLSLRDIRALLQKYHPEHSASLPTISAALNVVCRSESGVDLDTVLGGRKEDSISTTPLVEGLVRIGLGWDQPLFLPGTAAVGWLDDRGLLGD